MAEQVPDQFHVEKFEDLTPAIELYNALIGLGRYDDAVRLFDERLDDATLYRLSAARQRVELLERLFPDGLDHLPRLTEPARQAYTLNSLALAYKVGGQPGRAAPLYKSHNRLREEADDKGNLINGLENLASALLLSGGLRGAEAAARRALVLTREQDDRFWEAVSLYWLGLALVAQGERARPVVPLREAETALRRSLRLFIEQNDRQFEGVANAYLADWALASGDPSAARQYADRAWELANIRRNEADFIRAAVRQGQAALALGDLDTADERLHYALARARSVNLVEEELPALVALAELARQRNDPALARELLDQVWESAERGPYPLYHADALNVLATIEREAGNSQAAIEAATKAYQLAWCDGISADGSEVWAYVRGLDAAKAHLDALGAPYPDMPSFNPADHEPLPEVEIDPPDEETPDEG